MRLVVNCLLINIVFLAAGCSELDFGKPRSNSENEGIQAFNSKDFFAEFKAMPEPNHYQTILHLPSLSPQNIVVQRTDEATHEHVIFEKKESATIVDDNLGRNKSYRYELGTFENGKFNGIETQNVKTGEDFEVTSLYTFTTEFPDTVKKFVLDYKRIFIRSNGEIKTEGKNVEISAEEIISNNGVIETFSETDQAPFSRDGRAGGSFLVHANKLTGSLTIKVIGETGGAGSTTDVTTAPGQTDTRIMRPGEGGSSGKLHLSIPAFQKRQLRIVVTGGAGGPLLKDGIEVSRAKPGLTEQQDPSVIEVSNQ